MISIYIIIFSVENSLADEGVLQCTPKISKINKTIVTTQNRCFLLNTQPVTIHDVTKSLNYKYINKLININIT